METIPRLGELEIEVLELVWSARKVDVREAHRRLGEPRGITSNTVQSALERLFRKGLLERERIGHAYQYSAALSRDEFRARAAAQAVGELHGAQADGVLAAFVEMAAKADRANLDRLEAIISAARAKRARR
ncbi:Transcriptional regulator, MecI family [Labilithrix luteola]|uniref:Transcriptional regulator, MecI family n=1 Tax=Labilithrix luteola TaxID=1391654 RepID=A0A0K1PSB9_9BACT|nr:BlaI/MecI/CopY family transcriptional regulator [Labilithrix luteola]AKU96251.1 Transcriptional regulator, MecI family [Labilithrix luteola]